MGYLDNEYGWIGDENHAPKYISLIDNFGLAVMQDPSQTDTTARGELSDHCAWLEGLLELALQEAQRLYDAGEDTPFDWMITEFEERR